jgi:signal transduction histidine kinase/DNA-binding response OmpR family regulator/HPt (histidine-containing phosphotransfer) domain-containing protein
MLKKIRQLLVKYIFSEDLPLRGRTLNLVITFGILAAFTTAVTQIIERNSPASILVILGIVGVAFIMLIVANRFRAYRTITRIAVITVCEILLPLLFFANGGISSGIAGFFVMSMVLIFLVMDGRECAVHVLINMTEIFACYYITGRFPNLVIPFVSDSQRLVDHIQTIFIGGLFIGTVIKFQTMIYTNEKQKAEDATRAKADFLANVSHEIRTPLNAIIGLGELELRKDLEAGTMKNIEKIYDSGKILLSIINDLLDISKIESGRFELIPAEYNVPSFINDTVSLNIVRIGSKPISFRLKIDKALPSALFGDELRIRQILNNLLSNAFKYTLEGSVELFIGYEPSSPESITLVCMVSDTGIGIREADIEKLFSAYNQVDTRSNRHIEGTGLGLSICKNMTDMMGGTITVSSKFGEGSVFTVRIPQKVVSEVSIGEETARNLENFQFVTIRRERRSMPRFQMPYARVLVVDDVATNLDVAMGMMLPYGVTVDCASSGPEAVALIRNEQIRYTAVFMDHMMPGMDGVEATRIIRSEIDSDYARTIPIIALTANALVGNEEMFLSKGFQAFLSKPIDTVKLDIILNKWIRDRKQEKPREAAPSAGAEATTETGIAGEGEAESAEGEEFSARRPLREWELEGLNISNGINRFGGNEEIYIRILKSYVTNMPGMLDKVRNCFEEGGPLKPELLQEYTILVHGIKGSSYGISADGIGRRAEELEMAAKRQDLPVVAAKSASLIREAEDLIRKIQNRLKDAEA